MTFSKTSVARRLGRHFQVDHNGLGVCPNTRGLTRLFQSIPPRCSQQCLVYGLTQRPDG